MTSELDIANRLVDDWLNESYGDGPLRVRIANALVAAKAEEREACAKICDELPETIQPGTSLFDHNRRHDLRQGSAQCARAIRNREPT